MPLRTSWSEDTCPIARAADVLGDPWAVLVLREIFMGNNRFDGIKKQLGVADKVLSDRIRRLSTAGVLTAEPYGGGASPRKEYLLTAAGVDALPVLHALAAWAKSHTKAPSANTLRIICTACGTESLSGITCQSCGREMTASATAWNHPKSPDTLIDLGNAARPGSR
ncbi:helix-turn-helix transcriptional regulator [Paenarthrobacter sp. CM16]|uniref:winged helix-turn-helix transcriptional regulator n=1 Tax=Paenarthrobacter sp. CM16 TaxID=2738447 RepID=UPI0015569DCA|nr:helix-turn-helix domain-containing protein [Paenarthrobacter sp. CM16]NQD87597.1 helix-turn-helix transcriptional regulator [Paenarthrobacter sp. CM16]